MMITNDYWMMITGNQRSIKYKVRLNDKKKCKEYFYARLEACSIVCFGARG